MVVVVVVVVVAVRVVVVAVTLVVVAVVAVVVVKVAVVVVTAAALVALKLSAHRAARLPSYDGPANVAPEDTEAGALPPPACELRPHVEMVPSALTATKLSSFE